MNDKGLDVDRKQQIKEELDQMKSRRAFLKGKISSREEFSTYERSINLMCLLLGAPVAAASGWLTLWFGGNLKYDLKMQRINSEIGESGGTRD